MLLLLLLLPLLSPAHSAIDPSAHTDQSSHPQGVEPATPPAPSLGLLDSLFQTTTALLTTSWTDSEADSRQGPPGVIRITVGAFLAALLSAVLGVVGLGGVGVLALKALSVGSLALLLAAAATLKHKHASGGQTVHYVPVHSHSGGAHHDYLQERAEYLPPYLDRNV